MSGEIHIVNQGRLMMSDSSQLIIDGSVYLGAWGTALLSLTGQASLSCTDFNFLSGGTLALDLTAWQDGAGPAAAPITAGDVLLMGTLNLLNLAQLHGGQTLTLIETTAMPTPIYNYFSAVKVDGVAQALTEIDQFHYSFTYNGTDYLLDYAGGVSGDDVTLSISASDVGGTEEITVPEPGTWVMLLGGFGTLVLFLRRRRAGGRAGAGG